MEEWADIEGYPGYQVSNEGRLRSNRRSGSGRESDEWHTIKGTTHKTGYQFIAVKNPGQKPKQLAVHRLVAKSFVDNPNPEEYDVVRHLDDNPQNNKASNLAWGTQKDNIRDEIEHGHYHNNMTPELNALGRKLAEPHNESISVPILASNRITGEQLEFRSINEAAKVLGLSKGSIRYCVRGEREYCGDWIFESLDDTGYEGYDLLWDM